MKKITKTKLLTWRIDPLSCRQVDIARIFGVTAQCVSAWACPRLADGNYRLADVIAWRIDSQKPESSNRVELENQKLTLQCEKMTIDIERLKSESIPIETHKQIMTSRALSLKNFLFELVDKNSHLLCQKSVEQVRPQLREMMTAALNHYSQNHR